MNNIIVIVIVIISLGGKDRTMTGILAVQGRDHDKIRQRQEELVMDGGLHRVLQDPGGSHSSSATCKANRLY